MTTTTNPIRFKETTLVNIVFNTETLANFISDFNFLKVGNNVMDIAKKLIELDNTIEKNRNSIDNYFNFDFSLKSLLFAKAQQGEIGIQSLLTAMEIVGNKKNAINIKTV